MSTTNPVKKSKEQVFDIPFARLISNPNYANASFYGFIISKMHVSIGNEIPTAGVGWFNNKYNLLINPEYFSTLDLDERIGVLIHEALHAMLKHNFRQGERDQKLFNIAADIALNQLINKPAKLPEGAMFPETFDFPKNLTAEGYYELLKQEKEKQEQEKQEKEENGEQWGGPSDGKPDLTGEEELTIDSHDKWSQAGEGENEADAELARATMEKMIKEAMEKSRGNLPANINELLDLWTRRAKISWKRVLKRIISSKKGSKIETIKRRDRRQPHRKDLKGKKVFYDTPNVLTLIDVSGSVSDAEIFEGLSEIAEVCRVTKSDMKLIQVDTEAQPIETFSEKQKTFTRKAGGGTYIGAGIKQVVEEKIPCDVVLVITDGMIENVKTDKNWNKFKKPVIFLTTTGEMTEVCDWHKVFDIKNA